MMTQTYSGYQEKEVEFQQKMTFLQPPLIP